LTSSTLSILEWWNYWCYSFEQRRSRRGKLKWKSMWS